MKTTKQIESFFLGFTVSAVIFGAILAFVLSNEKSKHKQAMLIVLAENEHLISEIRKRNTDVLLARELLVSKEKGTLIYH